MAALQDMINNLMSIFFIDGRREGGTRHQKYTSNFKSHSEEPSHLFEFRKKVSSKDLTLPARNLIKLGEKWLVVVVCRFDKFLN